MSENLIKEYFFKHDCTRIRQGDIIRGFSFTYDVTQDDLKFEEEKKIKNTHRYVVILSQDCDLEQCFNPDNIKPNGTFNQFYPNVLFAPAFIIQDVKDGIHLKSVFNITQENLKSDLWRPISKNKNERYHFIKGDDNFKIPDLVIDFKIHYSLPISFFKQKYNNFYIASLNILFRETLSQRFAYYINRIPLPEIAAPPNLSQS